MSFSFPSFIGSAQEGNVLSSSFDMNRERRSSSAASASSVLDEHSSSRHEDAYANSEERLKPEVAVRRRSLTELVERNITVAFRRVSYDLSLQQVDPITEKEAVVHRNLLASSAIEAASDAASCSSDSSNVNPVIESLPHSLSQIKIVEVITQSLFTHLYPLDRVRSNPHCSRTLRLGEFHHIESFAEGSNSTVFIAHTSSQRKIVIKMLSDEAMFKSMAKLEFKVECELLERLSHPNIVKMFGSGSDPLPFIALEWVAGGTLHQRLAARRKRKSLTDVLFPPEANMREVMGIGVALADAFDYLHRRAHPHAAVLHRDLKPENIAFSADGTLKLIDFGLAICVKKFETLSTTYLMTGNTGSLRYMAPEVALSLPYNEKVDVHSFGIVLWQVASLDVPFKGFTRDNYMKFVVAQGLRPEMYAVWPRGFQTLLQSCWNCDFSKRPSFEYITSCLSLLLTGSL